MQDNYRIYQQGLALILAILVVAGGAIVLLTMAIERAPAVAAVAFVIICALLIAGVFMYRRDQHRMMTFVENVVAHGRNEAIEMRPSQFLPPPQDDFVTIQNGVNQRKMITRGELVNMAGAVVREMRPLNQPPTQSNIRAMLGCGGGTASAIQDVLREWGIATIKNGVDSSWSG